MSKRGATLRTRAVTREKADGAPRRMLDAQCTKRATLDRKRSLPSSPSAPYTHTHARLTARNNQPTTYALYFTHLAITLLALLTTSVI